MTKKYTLSLMFDRGEVLRSYTLNDNVAIKSEGGVDEVDLPQYVYERLALLKMTENLTTVADIGRRIGLGYYTIYLDVNEYNEVNKIIKQRKSANKKKQVSPAVTPKKRGRPRKNTLTPVNKKPSVAGRAKAYRLKLEKEVLELHQFCLEWRAKCDKQESEIARIQHLYMDSQAIVRYLESKIAQLLK